MATTTTLGTPLKRRVKVIELGAGTPVVFLHSGVGSAGEWKQVLSRWPGGYRLVAIEAYRDGTGRGRAGRRSLDDHAKANHTAYVPNFYDDDASVFGIFR